MKLTVGRDSGPDHKYTHILKGWPRGVNVDISYWNQIEITHNNHPGTKLVGRIDRPNIFIGIPPSFSATEDFVHRTVKVEALTATLRETGLIVPREVTGGHNFVSDLLYEIDLALRVLEAIDCRMRPGIESPVLLWLRKIPSVPTLEMRLRSSIVAELFSIHDWVNIDELTVKHLIGNNQKELFDAVAYLTFHRVLVAQQNLSINGFQVKLSDEAVAHYASGVASHDEKQATNNE